MGSAPSGPTAEQVACCGPMKSIDEWESDSSRRRCRCCDRTFHPFLRRHHCRRCGSVVCARCAPMRTCCGVRVCYGCGLTIKLPRKTDPRNTPKARYAAYKAEYEKGLHSDHSPSSSDSPPPS
eukprot:Sspe_Gene.106368::Locus_84072_Transcript_1_1_Confidence_1.000_Length_624::g.106368::m.106368